MPKGFTKGLKPLIIKQLALLIGICYLLNPLQNQINEVFHVVSHALETPNYIISHDSNTIYEHQSYEHSYHRFGDLDHDHLLVDFINSVLEASNDNEDSEDSILTQTTIDKHLNTYQFQIPACFNFDIPPKFWWPQEQYKLVDLNQLKEPPQYCHCPSV